MTLIVKEIDGVKAVIEESVVETKIDKEALLAEIARCEELIAGHQARIVEINALLTDNVVLFDEVEADKV